MPRNAQGARETDESLDDGSKERHRIEGDRSEIYNFVKQLTGDDIKTGGWFTKLLSHSLSATPSRWTRSGSRLPS